MERCHAGRWKGVTLGGQNIVVINTCVTGVDCGRACVGHRNGNSKLSAHHYCRNVLPHGPHLVAAAVDVANRRIAATAAANGVDATTTTPLVFQFLVLSQECQEAAQVS